MKDNIVHRVPSEVWAKEQPVLATIGLTINVVVCDAPALYFVSYCQEKDGSRVAMGSGSTLKKARLEAQTALQKWVLQRALLASFSEDLEMLSALTDFCLAMVPHWPEEEG